MRIILEKQTVILLHIYKNKVHMTSTHTSASYKIGLIYGHYEPNEITGYEFRDCHHG